MYGKVLMISYHFPPLKAVGSIRNYNVAEQLAKQYKQLHVFTTSNVNWLPKEPFRSLKNVKLTKLWTVDYKTIMNLFSSSKPRSKIVVSSSGKLHWSHRLLDSFPFNVLIGEGGFLYVLSGLIYGLIQIRKVDLIYSSFRPFSDILIAYSLKRLRPEVKWIADFRDLPIEPDGQNVFWKKWQERIITQVLNKSDQVTCVNRGIASYLVEYRESVQIVRNGYSQDLLNRFSKIKQKPNDKFRIVYTGALYRSRRDPSHLFQSVVQLIEEGLVKRSDLFFEYAGKEGKLWMSLLTKYGLQDLGVDHGYVTYDKSLSLQKNAEINLLLTWSYEKGGTIPAKLYEYVVANRPILLIVNGPRDAEIESLFSEFSNSAVAYSQNGYEDRCKQFVLNGYREWKNGTEHKTELCEKKISNFRFDMTRVIPQGNTNDTIKYEMNQPNT